MPQDDLGLVRNDIVSVERTSGTGQPGSVDTYTITMRSGATFTFTVTNGANGGTGGVEKHEFTTVSNFTDWYIAASTDLSRIISIAYFDADYNSMSCFLDNTGATTKLYKMLPNGTMQELTALSSGEKIVVFYKIDESTTIDTELDENSVNPVQNKVITKQVNKMLAIDTGLTYSSFSTIPPSDTMDNPIYVGSADLLKITIGTATYYFKKAFMLGASFYFDYIDLGTKSLYIASVANNSASISFTKYLINDFLVDSDFDVNSHNPIRNSVVTDIIFKLRIQDTGLSYSSFADIPSSDTMSNTINVSETSFLKITINGVPYYFKRAFFLTNMYFEYVDIGTGTLYLIGAKSDTTTVTFSKYSLKKFLDYSSRRYIVIGDSYAGTSHWPAHLAGVLGKNTTFTTLLANTCYANSDLSFYNVSRGGQGFTNNGGGAMSGNGFLNLLTASYDYITDKNTITDIVILAGENDSFYEEGSEGATLLTTNMTAFNAYCRTNYPGAQISIGFIGKIRGTNPSGILIDNLLRCFRTFTMHPVYLGWKYLTNVQYSLYTSDDLLSSDNMHPADTGGRIIANNAAQALRCGSADIASLPDKISAPFTGADGMTIYGSSSSYIIRYCNNGRTTIFMKMVGFARTDGTENVPIALNGEMILGTQSAFYANKDIYVPFDFLCAGSDNVYKMTNGQLHFTGYNMYLVNNGRDGAGSINFNKLSSPANIQFEVPTMWIS